MALVSPVSACPAVGMRETPSPATTSAATAILLARSIINQNRVRHATDRYRSNCFVGRCVHNREVVTEPVSNIERHIVGAKSDAPSAASNQHVAFDLS